MCGSVIVALSRPLLDLRHFAAFLAGLLLLSLADIGQAQSVPDQVLLGPKQYVRTSGDPNQYTDTFTVPASIGAPFQLHIVNGQANGANRISSAWITVNGVQVAGPNDFGQNVAAIDRTITARPSNTLTVKVASAPGAYLTITVYGTKILSTPASLTPNPLTLTVGATGTLTATLAPTPTISGTLTLSSGTPSIASVPASVAFTAGQASVPIPVTAVDVGSSQITVSANGGSVSSTVQITPAPPTITDVRPSTLTVTQGGRGTLTMTISAAQSTATAIALQSSASGIASVPSSVTVPAGQTSASVTVSANTPGTAQITASLNGTSAASTITVSAALPTIVSLLPTTVQINLGASGLLTATISASQSGASPIGVTVTPSGLVTVPSTVTVPAGQLTVAIPFTTVGLGTAMVQVTLNGSTADAAVQVTPPPPAVVSLLPSSLPIVVGATGQLTVTLNAAQLTNMDVGLSTNNAGVLQVPPTVTVPAGQTQAVFTITGLAIGDATVTATLGTSGKSALVHVQPPPATVVSLLPNPLPLQQGATGTLTLTINAAQLADTIITLSNSAPTIAQTPSSETVPAGQTSTSIAINGLQPGTATISATLNGTTVSSTVQVTAPPPIVTTLTPLNLTLPKGTPGVLTVTVSRAPTVATPVTLSSSATGVATVPATVTIPAGALTADLPVLSVGEGTATITASLNGGSAASTITVTPAELVTLTLSPQSLTLIVGEVQLFTATGTMTDGTTQDFTTRVTWASSNQNVASIDTTEFATALAIGVATISASFTTSSGPVSANTTVTVLTPPPLTLTPATATVRVTDVVSLTINSASPARYGGLLITLTPSGIGRVLAPISVQLLEGQSSATVTITGAAPGGVTLTATAPARLAGSSTLTVIPQPPVMTGFSPTQGPVGTVVTITGANFETAVLGNNSVKFNGTPAIVTAATATTLTTTVPQGATNGVLTITTTGGTAVSAQPFTVTTTQDFSLTAAPGQISVVQGQPITAQVQVANVGANPVTNFVALAATGLPAGMTGTFTPSQIAGGQSATLTLNTGTASAGPVTMTITATAVIEGQTIVRQSPLQVTVLPAGSTTLAGRILATKDDAPIAGARVSIGALTVTADASGNFLFTNPPTGPQVLLIDGPSGLYPGSLPVQMTIQPSVANVLPYPVFLHEVSQNYFPIAQGGQSIIAPPDVPNFTMMIPAGTTITGWDGQPNVKVSVTPVPIDRLPIPAPPANVPAKQVYMFNFGKPGGGYPSRPIPIIMPNDTNAPPGTRMDMWYYDEGPTPDPNSHQWKVYGQGTVRADGLSVVPDPGVGQPKFCCGGGSTAPGLLARISAAALDLFDLIVGGDPVLLQTGMFTLDQTDMVLPGRIPVVIRRAYHSQDPGDPPGVENGQPPARELVNSNAFGFNTTLMDYDDRLVMIGGQALAYTSGFSKVQLALQPDGTYRAMRTPMVAGWVGRANQDGTSTLRDKHGTVRTFGSDGWIRNITDRNGNIVTIARSGSQIQQIIEPGGRALTFQYSGGGISQITDPLGRTVTYSYEAPPPTPRGTYPGLRLRTATNPAGGTTTYTYTGPYNVASVTDARGLIYLTNTYCSGSTCPLDPAVVTQAMADGSVTSFDYVVTNQTVMQTTVTDPRGNKTVHRFNSRGHEIAVVDALGQQTRMTRDYVTNQIMEVRDPLNRLTKYTYDAVGNVTSVIDPQGNPTIFEYEPTFNRLTKTTDALNQITRFTYNPANGDLLTATDPLSHTTTVAYNGFGQSMSATDPLTNTTAFEYDNVGNLVSAIDPMGNKTQRTYDAVSRLIALTDPRGKSTQFTYDNLNRVGQIQDAINGVTAFSYDPNGNLLTVPSTTVLYRHLPE
jgi:YD repeat-containing protein